MEESRVMKENRVADLQPRIMMFRMTSGARGMLIGSYLCNSSPVVYEISIHLKHIGSCSGRAE